MAVDLDMNMGEVVDELLMKAATASLVALPAPSPGVALPPAPEGPLPEGPGIPIQPPTPVSSGAPQTHPNPAPLTVAGLKTALKKTGFQKKAFAAEVGISTRRLYEWFEADRIPSERQERVQAILRAKGWAP